MFGSSNDDPDSDGDNQDDNNNKLTCPNCGEALNDQLCFNEYAGEWVCTECGTHLRHSYSDSPYFIGDERNNDSNNYTYTSIRSNSATSKDKCCTPSPKKQGISQHWKATFIAMFVLIVTAVIAMGYWQYQKLTPIGYSADYFVGQHYELVLLDLHEAGFTNVHIESFEDLDITDADKENQVFQVEVCGNINFDDDSKYPYDTRITIRYHAIKLVTPPLSHKDAKEMNYSEVVGAFEDAGFVNIHTEVEYDVILGWFAKDGEVKSVTISGEKG